MISRYTSILFSLLVAITTASPHGVRDEDPVDLRPGRALAAHEALNRLRGRQEGVCPGFLTECGTGCMPTVDTCCAPEGDYYCLVMEYCTLGGCCPLGSLCTGTAGTTTITQPFNWIGSNGRGSAPATEPPAFPTLSDIPSNSMSFPPVVTEPSPSGPAASPSLTPAMPTQTLSLSRSMGPTGGGSPPESSSEAASPSETITSSPPQKPSSQPSPSVSVDAANSPGLGMGRVAAVAGLVVGVWGL